MSVLYNTMFQRAQLRVAAALAEHNMSLSLFFELLRKSRIELNSEMVMHLAINEPRTFKVTNFIQSV